MPIIAPYSSYSSSSLVPGTSFACLQAVNLFPDALPQMSQPPSLIILDRHMPDLDGHQTLEILKQHLSYKRIPVIMMSAHASSSEINNCYESGANSFILKRLDPASLQESLSTICQYWLELNQVSMAA